MIKAYIERSPVLNAHNPEEWKATLQLLTLADAGKLQLVTSPVSKREIEKCADPILKQQLLDVYELFERIPLVEDHKVLAVYSCFDQYCGGSAGVMAEDDPISRKLREVLQRTDAHHLMIAIRAGCDYFLTCDGDFLRPTRRDSIQANFSIQAMLPSNLVPLIPKPQNQCPPRSTEPSQSLISSNWRRPFSTLSFNGLETYGEPQHDLLLD